MSTALVTGATGFVGRALVVRLLGEGHTVTAWVRSPEQARARLGADVQLVDASAGQPALAEAVEASDAIINLAGESLAGGAGPRRDGGGFSAAGFGVTNQLVDALLVATRRPRVLVSGSAVGYYGDRGDEPLTEESPPGAGFLAEVCRAWEQAAGRAEAAGVRVVCARLGVVLGLGGGFIEKTMPLFRRGLGVGLGDGRQYVPWIHLDDVTALLGAACTDDRYRGPVNAVAGSVPMAELVGGLAAAVRRSTLLKVPAGLLRLGLGAAAEVVLGSQRVEGGRWRALGFQPRFPDLAGALSAIVGTRPDGG